MRKITAVTFLAAGIMLAGNVQAQQTAASQTQPAAAKSSASASKKTTAKTSSKASTSKTASPLVPKTQIEKQSYTIGAGIGRNLRKDSVDIDANFFMQGLKDALAGNKPLLTDQEAQAAIKALQENVRHKQEEKQKVVAEENKKEGDVFLAANKAKAGVITLPSGLQYKVLTQGTGAKPTATDTVVCNYRGTLVDGKEFDSSAKHGQPASFRVNQVIKGWTEILQLMPAGSKYEVVIPPDLAYGMRGAGSDIGPESTLVFEIELLSIKEAEKPAATAPATAPAEKPAEKK